MAARASSSSSEDVFSEESDSNVLNLYDSDGDNSELFEDSGPRPYQYEPRRARRNNNQDSTEPVGNDTKPLRDTKVHVNLNNKYSCFTALAAEAVH